MNKTTNLLPATRSEFGVLERPTVGDHVHIEGWAKGAYFIIVDLQETQATIKTCVTNRLFSVPISKLLQMR